jgi:hypothetical protein
VHTTTKITPFEAYYGLRPDLSHLKVFGSRVCVKISRIRRGKLDRHDFKGIFLGYTATDQNILYLDLDMGVVKRSHHAQFDEAWYLQRTRPPVAQLLYDIGIEPDAPMYSKSGILPPVVDTTVPVVANIVPWPLTAPEPTSKSKWDVPAKCTNIPLPLGSMTSSIGSGPITAKAAYVAAPPVTKPATWTPRRPRAINIMSAFDISKSGMATIYMSPDPYFTAFEKPLDLRQFDLAKHPTAGLSLYENNGRLHLATMSPSTPAAKIKDWRSRIRGAWLTKIGSTTVTMIASAKDALAAACLKNASSVTLLFAHPEI